MVRKNKSMPQDAIAGEKFDLITSQVFESNYIRKKFSLKSS